ncbi:LacI family DNA-binding transcriptional regulator [Anaeromicrobium sediminis]|uniref:Catabolite control protein A n=1 Tax=Anaeromicrobium sediminis TaxID=1478221 RepID=A0A267MN33_9FIRM|nr:LacI family DNA-binding transcriptional regulator [Anaeromicrobium sediminis]PAB60285.1 catabolite control protein A [Anaeromicrobium sediminis]
MAISIKDVAKMAEVSVATVSRVLNKNTNVKEETEKRVLDAIEKTGYKPNAIARSLKVKNTRTIGIMIPDISSNFFPEVVRGIEDVANEFNYNIILCNTDLDREKESKYLDILVEKQVDGIIYMSNTFTDQLAEKVKKMGIEIVLISTDYKDLPSITIDNVKASKDAVDYLIEKGYENIALIGGQMTDPNAGLPRYNGYINAMSHAGKTINKDFIVEGNYKFESGYTGMKKLLELEKKPDAVFTVSDEMAVGIIRAVLESGYKVPKDMAVIGFDNTNMAKMTYPSLTTLSQPLYEMGAVGMRLLTKLLNKEEVENHKIVLEHELIKRESA